MESTAMASLQAIALGTLVRQLYRDVPFYREALDAAGVDPNGRLTLPELALLPLTTRSHLREHYPFGLLGTEPEKIARLHATSGTKGKPTIVAYTQTDLVTWADLCARMLTAAGCRKGQFWYVASGYGLFTGGLGAHYGVERTGAAVVPASSGNTNRLLQLMSEVRPTGIHCIPSYMLRIAEVAGAAGLDPRDLGLSYGSFGGETWSEPLRRRIEALFGLEAYDVYGLSECYGPGVAFECEAHDGLHVNEDHFLMEILSPTTGQPVPDGEPGELVVTTLTKEAMPLLRYRTGDLTRCLAGPCPCGRRLRRIARVTGRVDDMLTVRGINLFPSEIERVLLGFREVGEEHRLLIERPQSLDILTVEVESAVGLNPTAEEANDLAGRIGSRLRQETGVRPTVQLVPAGSLPRSEGKAKRVVDRRLSET